MNFAKLLTAACCLGNGGTNFQLAPSDITEGISDAATATNTAATALHSCPITNVQLDFDRKAFLGTWFQLYYTLDFPYMKGECTTAKYYERQDGLLGIDNSSQQGK